jgi:hypothetical protein
MYRFLLTGTALLACCWAAAGCSSAKLETGYEPQKLGASETTRRGFYAEAFSPAANAAAMDDDEDADMYNRRPRY